jgi:hypothetical protein
VVPVKVVKVDEKARLYGGGLLSRDSFFALLMSWMGSPLSPHLFYFPSPSLSPYHFCSLFTNQKFMFHSSHHSSVEYSLWESRYGEIEAIN